MYFLWTLIKPYFKKKKGRRALPRLANPRSGEPRHGPYTRSVGSPAQPFEHSSWEWDGLIWETLAIIECLNILIFVHIFFHSLSPKFLLL